MDNRQAARVLHAAADYAELHGVALRLGVTGEPRCAVGCLFSAMEMFAYTDSIGLAATLEEPSSCGCDWRSLGASDPIIALIHFNDCHCGGRDPDATARRTRVMVEMFRTAAQRFAGGSLQADADAAEEQAVAVFNQARPRLRDRAKAVALLALQAISFT